MSLQRTVTTLAIAALAGMLYSNENIDVRSLSNAGSTKELYTVTVDSATDTDYVLTYTDVNSVAVVVTYNQGAAGTVEGKVNGLVLAFNQSDAFRSAYATKTSASTFTITARVPENTFGLVASAQMTAVNTTNGDSGSSIPFGRAVAFANTTGTQCKLPSTKPAKNLWTIAAAGGADGTYVLSVNGVTLTYTQGGGAGTATTVRDGLLALIAADVTLRDVCRTYIKDADEFKIEALVPGFSLAVSVDNTTGTGSDLTATETTAEVFGDILAGVAILSHSEANDRVRDLIDMSNVVAGTEGYVRGSAVNVLARGRVWVETEEAVAPGKPVLVRYTAGAGEKQGIFRTTPDSTDCVEMKNARWVVGNTGAGLAVLELL